MHWTVSPAKEDDKSSNLSERIAELTPAARGTAAEFLVSMRHFLPQLPQWMDQSEDPRTRPEACTYSMREIVMLALLMLCTQCGSRRQLDRKTLRERWKIENEGINTQKTGGYEMEHGYGVKGDAWKNYYLLMQIAQMLNDLYRLGDLPAKIAGDLRGTFAVLYGSVRNFAERLMESLRNDTINPESGPDPGGIQIPLPDQPLALMLN